MADKSYDSYKIVPFAQEQGVQAIAPCKANRKQQRALDKYRYKARHWVKNLFQRMKIFRWVAARDDKLDERFLGFMHVAGIMKWLH